MIADPQQQYAPLMDVLPGFEKVPAKITIPIREPSEATPGKRPYIFAKKMAKVGQMFLSGQFPYLLLSGPTGTGKSEFVEQLAAHCGWSYEMVPCAKTTEIAALMWQMGIEADGSTSYIDGPIVRAMKRGSILVLEEFNALNPSELTYLNTILDSRGTPEPHTGTTVVPHPDFRLAATCNDVAQETGVFKGTQTQNPAFLRRFSLKVRMEYLAEAQELQVIAARAPGIQKQPLRVMRQLAVACRKMADDGRIGFTCSPAELVAWARLLVFNAGADENLQLAYMATLLQVAALDALPQGEAVDVYNALDGVLRTVLSKGIAELEKEHGQLW